MQLIGQKKNDMELTDGVILLKPFELKDAPLHLAGEDAEQQKWVSGGKSTLESVLQWIQRRLEYWKNDGYPLLNFAIWVGADLVGMIEANANASEIEGTENGQANISYGIYPKYRGNGYAPRAVNVILPVLAKKGIKQAVMRINPKNINSLKIPVKCGFKEAGEIKTKNGEILKLFVKDLHGK